MKNATDAGSSITSAPWRTEDAGQRRDHPDQHRPRRQIGGACSGKWYGGVYGWGFSVVDPVTRRRVNRNNHHSGNDRHFAARGVPARAMDAALTRIFHTKC